VFQQAKEVGSKRVAGEPIGLERVLEVLDEIFTLAPLTLGVIEERGGKLRQRGDDKARILALLSDLRFHDYVARLWPALRPLGKGVAVVDGGPTGPKAGAGCCSGCRPLPSQYGTLCQAKHVSAPAPFSLPVCPHPQEPWDGQR
jgi:hypothetical protein